VPDGTIQEAIADQLARCGEFLVKTTGVTPVRPPLIIVKKSEVERFATDDTLRAQDVSVRALPARASRATLSAEIAFPREEVWRARAKASSPIPDCILPDSLVSALAHEAAHLWVFATIPDERKIPEAVHEGFAEWVSATLYPQCFAREGACEIANARMRAQLPDFYQLLDTGVRAATSPQLATAVAAQWMQRLAASNANIGQLLQSVASGAKPLSSVLATVSDARGDVAVADTAWPSKYWQVGRDVTALSGTGEHAPGFLLAPIPGSCAWLFETEEKDCSDFVANCEVTILGGGSPEFWLGFGFDDGRNGCRAVVPISGRAAVEAVVDGQPQYGFEEELGAGAVTTGLSLPIRIARRGRVVSFDVRSHHVEVPVRQGPPSRVGRFGIGARGGAIVVRKLLIDAANR
jgi:hypothetical protein